MKNRISFFIAVIISFLVISTYGQASHEQIQRTTFKGERKVFITDIDNLNNNAHNQLKRANSGAKAMYTLPDGYYLLGLNDLFANFDSELMIPYAFGPAYYSESTWKNLSTDANDFLWKYSGSLGDGTDTITSKAVDLVTTYTDIMTISPILEATGESGTSTYQWAQNAPWGVGYFVHGGAAYKVVSMGGEISTQYYGATNLDYITYGSTALTAADSQYPFGTLPGSSIVSVCEKFSKPTQTYILHDVKIHVKNFSAPSRTEFNLIIHRLVNGEPVDTIATATTFTENVVSNSLGTEHFLYFRNFRVKTDSGIILDYDEIEINDEIMLEFTGYQNKPGVTLAVISQNKPSIDGNSTAYVYGVKKDGTRLLVPSYNYLVENDPENPGNKRPVKTALGFIMNMSYPFIISEASEIKFEANPESETFRVYSHYPPIGVDEETGETYKNIEIEAPHWIEVEYIFDEESYLVNMTVTATPLPEDENVREGVIRLIAPASYENITVEQRRDWTGLETVKDTPLVSIHCISDNIEVEYPPIFTQLSVYNINGQIIRTYDLPSDGILTLKRWSSKGLVLFHFKGKEELLVKKFIN